MRSTELYSLFIVQVSAPFLVSTEKELNDFDKADWSILYSISTYLFCSWDTCISDSWNISSIKKKQKSRPEVQTVFFFQQIHVTLRIRPYDICSVLTSHHDTHD